MKEEQANKIITLLKKIYTHLQYIESNTSDLSSVDSNTDNTVRELKKIQDQLL